jgi:hypothetical protein
MQMKMEMEKLKAQLDSDLQKQKYEFEMEIEQMKQGVKLETNAMDNLPTKEMGMQMIDQQEGSIPVEQNTEA